MADKEEALTEASPGAAAPAADVEAQNAQVSEDGRSKWSSRWAFWLAAVGSAVGLGNLWRFPWQCAKWGGGPFLIAYIACLVTLGMPILTQELALGQKHRSGDIEAFGKMNWRLRGIGLASVIGTFGIITYYSVIIGMSLVFLAASMQTNLPYGQDNTGWWATDVMIICDYPPSDECLADFSWRLWLATLAVFVIVYFCVWKGVLSASNVVKVTMPLPILFLIILLVRSLFLQGAVDGIGQYLDFSDWGELESSGVWDAAVGQCFFSLSVCMGVMTAYGSYNPIKQDIATDEKVISLLDLSTSLFAGFVVYTVLGYLNHIDPSGGWYETASFGLVFSAYPVAITEFGAAEQLFGVLFFLVLFLLGIDSLFSMVEGLSTVIVDSDVGRQFNLTSEKTCLAICVCGALFSLLYCFGGGIFWLDIIDRYINNYGMVFLGICETMACGWFYGTDRQAKKVGEKAVDYYRIGFFLTWGISLFVAFIATIDYWWIGLFVGAIGMGISFYAAKMNIEPPMDGSPALTPAQEVWYIMGWEGTEELRDFMNGNVAYFSDDWENIKQTWEGEKLACYKGVSLAWGFLIKYFIPVVLSVVLVATMVHDSDDDTRYGGYKWKHLSMGIVLFSLMVGIVGLIMIFPQLLKQSSDVTEPTAAGSGASSVSVEGGKSHAADDARVNLTTDAAKMDDGGEAAAASAPAITADYAE